MDGLRDLVFLILVNLVMWMFIGFGIYHVYFEVR